MAVYGLGGVLDCNLLSCNFCLGRTYFIFTAEARRRGDAEKRLDLNILWGMYILILSEPLMSMIN